MNKKNSFYRKFLFYVIAFVVIVLIFFFRNYIFHKKENYPLNVKLITLNKLKKNPKPWRRLTQSEMLAINKKSTNNKITEKIFKIINPIIDSNSSLNDKQKEGEGMVIIDQDLDKLVKKLNENMNNIKSIDLHSLFENIEIADEIINQSPYSYSAYKAKLISMIYLESKFEQVIDDYEFNNVLYDLASFDLSSNEAIRKEAIIIATSSNQLLQLENKLNTILQMRDGVASQAFDSENNIFQFQAQDAELAVTEQLAILELENFKNNIKETSLSLNNEEIVEIVFLRLIAKDDLDTVINNAQEYLNNFPDSLNGYFYLIRALELKGEHNEIDQVISSSSLTTENQKKLRKRLLESLNEDPKKYWENLIF